MRHRLPSLNGLRAFEAVARHLSFTKAAEELAVTQTAVSHQIRRLEDQLGRKLFDRRGRAPALTRAGQDYVPAVRAAFDKLQGATDKLLRADGAGRLTVSTLPSLAAKWLVPRLPSFQEAHPEIDVRVATSVALVDFRRDDVDVAIRYGHGDWPGLRADWLMTEETFPVCAPALRDGETPLRRPAELARHTLLHMSVRDDWHQWLTAAGVDGVDVTRGHTFDSYVTLLQAAIDGLGVALGRTPFVEADLAAGRLVAPFQVTLPADAGFYVVAPTATADRPPVPAFRDWLLQTMADAPPDDAATVAPPMQA